MIKPTKGNLLDSTAEALVNTVNTVGVMGKGLALKFKERFPENYEAYAAACREGRVRVGEMFVTPVSQTRGPRWIVNFPTKRHWRDPSQLQWIQDGLDFLKLETDVSAGVPRIAFRPAAGVLQK
jgi:O-acetyl-ADP-ribose deacetylase (regulator of RNase III)